MINFIKNYLYKIKYNKELKKESLTFKYLDKVLLMDKESYLNILSDKNFLPIDKYKFPNLIEHREVGTLNNKRYFDGIY